MSIKTKLGIVVFSLICVLGLSISTSAIADHGDVHGTGGGWI